MKRHFSTAAARRSLIAKIAYTEIPDSMVLIAKGGDWENRYQSIPRFLPIFRQAVITNRCW